MLVLKRHIDERIMIGDHIVIQVTRIRGGRDGWVRLGIEAPRDVPVYREEVYHAVQREERRRGERRIRRMRGGAA